MIQNTLDRSRYVGASSDVEKMVICLYQTAKREKFTAGGEEHDVQSDVELTQLRSASRGPVD